MLLLRRRLCFRTGVVVLGGASLDMQGGRGLEMIAERCLICQRPRAAAGKNEAAVAMLELCTAMLCAIASDCDGRPHCCQVSHSVRQPRSFFGIHGRHSLGRLLGLVLQKFFSGSLLLALEAAGAQLSWGR
jgi:hypothetical protein